MSEKKFIILGVSASIAIYKACDIIRRLIEEELQITVVMTPEAEELIRPIVFQSLSGNQVYRDLFQLPEKASFNHIPLAEKADLVLLAPATANIIGKIASGVWDDLLTCIVGATKAPVVLCPAMNENMYLNAITQENIAKLKRLGYRFVEPKKGKLACGKLGVGCLADTEVIVQTVKEILKKR